jgi:polyisoprenoid-binding protein YceI
MTWEIDTSHSGVTFSAKHMMVTTVRGTMAIADATLDFDEQHPERSSVSARIDTASIDTRSQPRDAHLRSADFLDVEQHPAIEFRSSSVERAGSRWKLHGDLTIRGTTRPVALDAEFHGVQANLQGGRRAAFSATTSIDREDWGLTWNVALEQGGWLVSKEIRIEIDLAAVEPVPPVEESQRTDREPAGVA